MLVTSLAVVLAVCRVEGILTKGENKTKDVEAQESISRGFTYGEEGHFALEGHGGHGFEGHGVHGFEGYSGHEGVYYDGHFDAEKYHFYEDHNKHEHHKHDPAYHKALAIKGLLIPLAGVALLGAAAAFVSNPILLQLGVISGSYGRKKRDTDADQRRRFRMLERFMAEIPRDQARFQEEKLFAEYLSCSGAVASDSCLERLACELHSPASAKFPVETDVMAIITDQILGNKYVSDGIKAKMKKAVKRGKSGQDCRAYECKQLRKNVGGQ